MHGIGDKNSEMNKNGSGENLIFSPLLIPLRHPGPHRGSRRIAIEFSLFTGEIVKTFFRDYRNAGAATAAGAQA